jgi:hypothetical protein
VSCHTFSTATLIGAEEWRAHHNTYNGARIFSASLVLPNIANSLVSDNGKIFLEKSKIVALQNFLTRWYKLAFFKQKLLKYT